MPTIPVTAAAGLAGRISRLPVPPHRSTKEKHDDRSDRVQAAAPFPPPDSFQPVHAGGCRLYRRLDYQLVGGGAEPQCGCARKPGGGHVCRARRAALAQFTLNEGVAAVALVVVVTLVASAARRRGQARAGLAAAAFGIAVAGISWAQLALGTWLFGGLVPDRRTSAAGALYHAITRMDGAKMFLLAAMALAISQLARSSRILPRWLAPVGVLLAAALMASGLGYLLLAPGLASAVYVSGILLLIFVSATGITLRSHGEDGARTQAGRTSSDADVTVAGQPGTGAIAVVANMPPGAATRNADDEPARS